MKIKLKSKTVSQNPSTYFEPLDARLSNCCVVQLGTMNFSLVTSKRLIYNNLKMYFEIISIL